MTLPQREHPDAVTEFDAAVRWYEEQEPGIGLALIDRAQQARQDINQWPNAAPPFTTADDATVIRGKAVRGYPYRIVYTVEPDTILILAYAHERREPGYWLHRLNSTASSPRRGVRDPKRRYTGTAHTRTITGECVCSTSATGGTPWSVTATAGAVGVSATVTAISGGLMLSAPDSGVDCQGFGVAWSVGADAVGTDCSVVFTRSSAHLGGTTPLDVSALYTASWSASDGSGGDLGSVTTTRTVDLPVAEIQTVVTSNDN